MKRHRAAATHPFALLSTAALLALAAGSPASACTVVVGVPSPTNYEMVRVAPTIVLAKSVAWEPSDDLERYEWGGAVRFEVEEVLKGDFRPAAVTLDGHLEFAGQGPEDDFSRARPGAFAGKCHAGDYRLNHHYLLFLEWDELNERWAISGEAFARVNEEVDVPDSPWLKAVRHYVRVTALGDYDKEKAALRSVRAKAAAGKAPKIYPKALVKDIDRHFQTPSMAKSPADLIDLYEHARSDKARRDALWGLAMNAPPAARTILRAQLLKETREDWLGPLGEYFSTVPDHKIVGPLSQTLDHLPLDSRSRQGLLRALSKAAVPADAPLMAELLREAAEIDEATILAQWFAAPGNNPRIAIDILHRRLEDTPGDITRYQDALAVLGDPAAVAWAEERIGDRSDLWSPWSSARVLAFSPLPAADAAARRIIQSGCETCVDWLVMAFTDPFARGNPRRWDRLDDILRSQSTNAASLAKLKTAFFYLRKLGTDEDKAMANRLFECTREAIAALPSRQK